MNKLTLQEYLQLDWVEDLSESLNTRVPVDDWYKEAEKLIGVLTVEDTQYTIEFEPIVYNNFKAINVGFSRIVDGNRSQELTFNNNSGSAVLGAISNAIREKLNDYEYDAVVFIAADNVPQRMRIYNMIANRFLQSSSHIIENIDLLDGRKTTILITKRVSNDDVEEFKQHLMSKNKL